MQILYSSKYTKCRTTGFHMYLLNIRDRLVNFDQRSSGSKPGSLSGSEGIQMGLSSVRLIHSEREDADNSADITVKSCTYITSRAFNGAQTKK
jgi:hypothetical protein